MNKNRYKSLDINYLKSLSDEEFAGEFSRWSNVQYDFVKTKNMLKQNKLKRDGDKLHQELKRRGYKDLHELQVKLEKQPNHTEGAAMKKENLKKELNSLGVPVIGNYVKKSDLMRAITANDNVDKSVDKVLHSIQNIDLNDLKSFRQTFHVTPEDFSSLRENLHKEDKDFEKKLELLQDFIKILKKEKKTAAASKK